MSRSRLTAFADALEGPVSDAGAALNVAPGAHTAQKLPIPMKPPLCSEMIAPPVSGMISPPV